MRVTSSPLSQSLLVSSHGIQAQNDRFLILAQNLANASSRPVHPGDTPYQRQLVAYASVFDAYRGVHLVQTLPPQKDQTPFKKVYDPSDPAADEKGYVLQSNVNPTLEMADIREAGLSHEANLKAFERALGALSDMIHILK